MSLTHASVAYILPSIGEDNFKRILDRHGEDRVLFASDSPWTSMKDSIAILRSFGLGKSAEDKILYQNAKRLLGL
jgi:predicted TIM-barrel fold metal-dependent hydrolase